MSIKSKHREVTLDLRSWHPDVTIYRHTETCSAFIHLSPAGAIALRDDLIKLTAQKNFQKAAKVAAKEENA